VANIKKGRENDEDITIFDSTGLAIGRRARTSLRRAPPLGGSIENLVALLCRRINDGTVKEDNT